jgi:hypothetical protein
LTIAVLLPADVGFRKIIGDNRYLGLVKNIVNSKEPHIKSLVDKHRGVPLFI